MCSEKIRKPRTFPEKLLQVLPRTWEFSTLNLKENSSTWEIKLSGKLLILSNTVIMKYSDVKCRYDWNCENTKVPSILYDSSNRDDNRKNVLFLSMRSFG